MGSSIMPPVALNFHYNPMMDRLMATGFSVGLGVFALKKVMEVAQDRFPHLKDSSLSKGLMAVGVCVVVAGSILDPQLTFLISCVALGVLCLNGYNLLSSSRPSSSLPSYLTDLTEQAKRKSFPKCVGNSVTQAINGLEATLRRTQVTNAILIGPSGVGKTAIIRTLAQKIADNEIDEESPFRGQKIIQLNLEAFLGGNAGFGLPATGIKGGLSSRVEELARFVRSDPKIVLFMDEIHLLWRTSPLGTNATAEDLGELLKTHLDRNEFRMIGATTNQEYMKYAKNNPNNKNLALNRRFQTVVVKPPTPKECVKMMQAQKLSYESHYRMNLSDRALASMVAYASRPGASGVLPYSAVDLLEKICSSYRPSDRPEELQMQHVLNYIGQQYGLPINEDWFGENGGQLGAYCDVLLQDAQ